LRCCCHSLVVAQQLVLAHGAHRDARERATRVREARAQRLVEGCETLDLRGILRFRGPAGGRIGRFEFVKILPVFIERSDWGSHNCRERLGQSAREGAGRRCHANTRNQSVFFFVNLFSY